ncbi:hypothetical protein ABB37_05023 [Leptomonas pyrrhocoris]|uniref:Uncharacterized protein n=1 Tax=Leptomonas pyrrhocoris TaxID=157538 RepID=A0A0M9G0X6_LEPPY|nr:hypothetical protein ABB37_05023 [Leptomonas pyrrhocoris]KPA79983.1 hypothetical protein ABB37_05023 [Leptomonas pyrrhocoris]|eukprot:XP_015658422.1 hypothetical protein ABB37_05023 [Leptomonas pyrrhocoris]
MRHLSLRRLPPFSHDPSLTSSFHDVRRLSATAAVVGGSRATSSSPSSSVALPKNPLFSPRLSRRQMRQREQKWGALWRYQPDSYPLANRRPTPLLMASSAAGKVTCADVAAERFRTFRQQAEFVGLVGPSRASAADPIVENRVDVGASEDACTEFQSFTTADSVRGTSSNATSSSTTNVKPSSSQDKDPLLAFLETHEDDAADLLAMWTSLHRSCVYASELSESVVLQVRYFFHSLLHNRAVAAAVEFYYRLMGLGVQLQQSDLLLLISSLPYEHAATTEAEQLQRAKEGAALEKDRLLWAKRRQEFKEAAQRTTPPKTVREKTKEALSAKSGGSTSAGKVELGTNAKAITVEGKVASSSHGVEAQEANLPNAIAHRVAFHQQPEWIKRWILYEASMGTLDGLDAQEGLPIPSTAAGNERASRISADALEMDDGAWPVDTSSNREAAVQSARAKHVMEVAAIVDHLRLLTLGAMQRDSTTSPVRPRLSLTMKRRAALSLPDSTSSAVERMYWREALCVVRKAFVTPLWTPLTSLPSSSPHFSNPLVLSGDVAVSLQRMMREAHTWEGALALLRLKVPSSAKDSQPSRDVTMSREEFVAGATLFTALAATAQPWRTQAPVEEWMHHHLLPRLAQRPTDGAADTAAAVSAIHALWLSHLCGVKAARPEQYITMSEVVARYLPAPCPNVAAASSPAVTTATQLLNAELSVMVAEVQAKADQAIAAFRHAVHKTMLARRAAQALAKSIQSGAYRLNAGEEGDEAQQARFDRDSTATSTLTPSTTSPFSLSPSLLSDAQVDAFVLCCAALKETVWLRFSTAAVHDRASVTADVSQFLERSFYGAKGLHAVYRELYGGYGNGNSTVASSAVTAATAVAAPERPFVSTVLAVTLLDVVQLLCTSASQRGRFGSQLANRDMLHLLVEFARRAMDGVQSTHIMAAPWQWAAEARVTELVTATARTLHVVVRALDVQPRNEKVIFGAMPERDLQLLAELARLTIKTADLATTQENRRGHSNRNVCSPVWRVLTSTASPRVLQGVQLCFHKSSSLGRRVRHHLTSHEATRLDALLGASRRFRRVVLRRSSTTSAPPQRVRSLDAGLVPRARVTDSDFVLALTMRDAVYHAVQRKATTDGVRASLQELAEASTSWKASLQLCQLVTTDVALARGTCDVKFFATVLAKMTSDMAESKSAVLAAGMRGGGGSSVLRRNWRRGNATARAAAAAVSVGPPSLWLSAIDVFWSAVDHTAGTSAAPSEHLRSDLASPENNNHGKKLTGAESQERAVLAQLLLPLIDFSRTVNRSDLGRQWRRTWGAKYSLAEKRSALFRRQNILALSALGDSTALERCVTAYNELDRDDALLCQVAAQHSDWQQALEALFKVYGTIDEHEQTQLHYPLVVAHAALVLLSRSPQNLSNTAMRLETLQGHEWDAACSAQVVRLLLRARRWSLALQHVNTALTQQPALQRVHALMTSSTAAAYHTTVDAADGNPCFPSVVLTPQEMVPYVSMLVMALQATAIGGDSATAPLYYDALKLALNSISQPPHDSSVASRSDAAEKNRVARTGAGSGLDTVLEMASAAAAATSDASVAYPNAAEKRSRVELRELSARARLLFFRAMTKKMMSTKGSSADQISEEGEARQGDDENSTDNDAVAQSNEYWDDIDAGAADRIHR